MRKTLMILLVFVLPAVLIGAAIQTASADKEQDDAIKMFKKYGCNECHSISAVGIEATGSKDGEEAEAKADEPAPPDLSAVGKERDAKWISNYLRKKEEIDGRKHEKMFKGSDAERRDLALWLASLKHDVEGDGKEAKSDAESGS